MKKINKNPFSNGDEHLRFKEANCDGCIKSSRLKRSGDTKYEDEYTRVVCAIQRDIFTRMWCDEEINERTVRVCRAFVLYGTPCPYRKTERKRYSNKRTDKRQLKLF